MNQHLIQINNNCGVVSDEDGNISLIKKENDLYDFEKTLLKENELETLELKLKNSKEALSDNNQNKIFGEIANAGLIVLEVAIFASLHSILSIKMLIAVMAIAYMPFKGLISVICGTRIGRHFKKKKLTADIEKIELDISTLEKELKEIKEKSKYKVEYQTATNSNEETSTKEICHEISMPIDNISERNNKVRVLSLSKRK